MPDAVRCRFDEVTPEGTRSIELSQPQGQLVAWKTSDVEGVLAEAEAATRRGWYAAGFVAYEAAPAFDQAFCVRADHHASSSAQLPLAWFGLFAAACDVEPLPRSGSVAPRAQAGQGRTESTHRSAPSSRSGRLTWACEIGSQQHREAVDSIRQAIAAGKTYLTNYTARFRRPWTPADNPFSLYEQLVSSHSSGFHAYLETSEWAIASGSPELFFEMRSGHLTTRPMKGTAPRGRWSTDDLRLAETLRTSAKERAENLMVVDLLRNDLGRIAIPGTVEVPDLWQIERHPTVWQLTSTVTATARPDVSLTDVFTALFPSGSVTGAPKVATMKLIADLEQSERGVYCGAVGLLRPGNQSTNGPAGIDAHFAVAIRTAVVDKLHRVAEYGSGGGITWDSSAASEWDEILVKTEALTTSRPGARPEHPLLETMAFDPVSTGTSGSGVRNLEGHLDRLESSAAYFGFPPPQDARQKILDAAARCEGPARIRLVLRPDGHIDVGIHPLADEPGATADRQVLCVDDRPVDSSDASLFHKTTDRYRYDERSCRHRLADDVILVNERGEVTETTRANLAVRRGARWFTPPLECGLLPGIERQRLVDCGKLTERAMTVQELRNAEAVATVSSLRGWRSATVRPDCRCSSDS